MPKSQPLWLVSVLLLLCACAQQVAPTGGTRDEVPPKILGSSPENKSVNFNAEKILIRFDEYVQIKDPSKILVSPMPSEKPAFSANGRTVEIKFRPGSLKANTTYTVNFGNTIADVHEANTVLNFSYVFSTGPELDSNRILGRIFDSETNSPQSNWVVGIFSGISKTDTAFRSHLPDYFALSAENGSFAIENLPIDTFYLLAFKDANGDFKYQYTEACAFSAQPLFSGIAKDSLVLGSFTPPLFPENTLVDTLCKDRGLFQFLFYKPANIKLETLGSHSSLQIWKLVSGGVDTLQVFFPSGQDSIQKFKLQYRDTLYQFGILHKSRLKYRQLSIQLKTPEKAGDSLFIISNLPLDTLVQQNITLKLDTLPVSGIWVRKNTTEYYFNQGFSAKANYTVIVNDSAMFSCYRQSNTQLQSVFSPKDLTQYGNLLLKFNSPPKNRVIIQLVQQEKDLKVVREFKGINLPKQWEIQSLEPGNYSVRVIMDSNKDGVYSSGNLKQWKQPERVYFFPQVIAIKAYWDIEQTIDFDEFNKQTEN